MTRTIYGFDDLGRKVPIGNYEVVPISLSINGNWTNTQYTSTAPDPTGLTFTCTYSDDSTATVAAVLVSPTAWSSTAGTQTATFSYTDAGTTVTTTKTATVVATALSSLLVSGSWTNTQYTGQAPDITGLSFTATYNNGNTASVSSSNITVSPSVWGSTAGTQTATFSYTSGGVTKTTTKTASVEESAPVSRKSVGGIIFYIDPTADGTYTFYNSNGTQVSAPEVGTDCTGWTYEVSGASKDKYYVVYDYLYTANNWCPYIDGAYVKVSTGYTATSIGSGKTNTAGIMAIDNGKYIQADSNGSPTVWYTISQMRSSKLGGCDDWFVGSKDELEQLRLSGAGNSERWVDNNSIWSSSEASSSTAWCWRFSLSRWDNSNKNASYCVCGVRAF